MFSILKHFKESVLGLIYPIETSTADLQVCKPSLSLEFNDLWRCKYIYNKTNCYAYALNQFRMGWAHPGLLAETSNEPHHMEFRTVKSLHKNIVKDGLEEISSYDALSGHFHVIAARANTSGPRVKDGYRDFHFFRRNNDGLWSHKSGGTEPELNDGKTPFIENPEKINGFPYDRFVGFFVLPEPGVSYKPRITSPLHLRS